MKYAKKILVVLLILVALLVTTKAALGADELNITSVTFNGGILAEGGNSTVVKPLQSVALGFTLANQVPLPLTVYSTRLTLSPGKPEETVISNDQVLNIQSNQSKSHSLNVQIPLSYKSGNYDAALTVEGQSDDGTKYTDEFKFTLKVQQNAQEVMISGAEFDPKELACKPSSTLTVKLTNLGSVDQTLANGGVKVSVKGPSGFSAPAQKVELKANSQTIVSFLVSNALASGLALGDNSFTIEATYWYDQYKDTKSATLKKKSCLQSYAPTSGTITLPESKSQTFSLATAESTSIQWYVNDVVQASSTDKNIFTFTADKVGKFTIKVTAGTNLAEDTHSWEVIVSNQLTSSKFTTNIPTDVTLAQLTAFPNLAVENTYGTIQLKGISNLSAVNLDAVINIADGMVSIDSTTAPSLNQPATITLKKTFTDYTIFWDKGFNTNPTTVCPATICTVKSNAANAFVFEVTGFSTYKVVENLPAAVSISPLSILFDQVDRNTDANLTITVTNTGTSASLTGLKAELTGVSTKYNAQLSALPTTLAPGASATLILKITVPKDEISGSHSIGTLKVISNEANNSATISLNPKSFLDITKVEINGDEDGDLEVDKVNDIEVTIENKYSKDMEDVTITVTILDVDGDDLEEESESFDLDQGDDDTVTLSFDLSKEELDEDEYSIQIEAEGDGADGSTHKTLKNMVLKVKREKHDITITKAVLSSETLQCPSQTTLSVDIKNYGKSNEHDLEINVKNTALGLSLSKANIDLDKYSGDDHEYDTTFIINAEKATAGTYPIIVELYREGEVEDSVTINLVIAESCSLTTTKALSENTEVLAQQLQQQLEQQLSAKKMAEQKTAITTTPTTTISFRDTPTYTLLLGTLVMLIIIALLLGIALLARGRR
ncbi:hypothetical protein HZC32_03635 [Candidatus Woesearchaeota archaeon]|nr:hypothetical protein [Candidatus Woesearchaeota archaeon]